MKNNLFEQKPCVAATSHMASFPDDGVVGFLPCYQGGSLDETESLTCADLHTTNSALSVALLYMWNLLQAASPPPPPINSTQALQQRRCSFHLVSFCQLYLCKSKVFVLCLLLFSILFLYSLCFWSVLFFIIRAEDEIGHCVSAVPQWKPTHPFVLVPLVLVLSSFHVNNNKVIAKMFSCLQQTLSKSWENGKRCVH